MLRKKTTLPKKISLTIGLGNMPRGIYFHKPPSEETKRKMSEAQKRIGNKPPYRKGYHLSEETKKKLSISNKGQIQWIKGRKQTEEHIRKRIEKRMSGPGYSTIPRGEKHYLWIKDRTVTIEKHRMRTTAEWSEWRKSVFERDHYSCRECDAKGVYLEPHHIVPLRMNMESKYQVSNGITLCRPCHQKTVWKEEQFVEKYSQLVVNRV